MYKKYSKNVGNGSYLSTEFTVIACRSPYDVFLYLIPLFEVEHVTTLDLIILDLIV